MKILKYILFAVLISVINFSVMISLSSSFRQDIFELLKKFKFKVPKNQEINSNDSLSTNYEKQEKTITKKSLTQNKKNVFQPQKIRHKKPPANSTNHTVLSNIKQDKLDFKFIGNNNEKDTSQSVNRDASLNSKDQGFIHITSTPDHAWVTIDDSTIGQTPLTAKVSPSGIYNVGLKLKYFEWWNKDFEVHSSEVTKVHAKLDHGKGSLTIISTPDEADVYIDEKHKGKTPLTIKQIIAGKHEVNVMKEKKEYIGEVEILPEQKNILNINLKVLKTKLSVASNPAGANIYLNGKKVGTTPGTIDDFKVGNYQLVLEKGESLAYIDSIFVSPEKDNAYSLILENKSKFKDFFSAKLKINSELKDAYAYVDGRFCGTVPAEIHDLRSGELEIYIIKSSAKESYSYKTKIMISSNETKEILIKKADFKFKKLY